jgi:hypothetical protein
MPRLSSITSRNLTGIGVLAPIKIGAAYGGGYFAGRFTMDGGVTTYKLIVAPKAYETTRQIKTTFTGTGNITTVIDGFARSNEMNTAEYPAASYCRGLNIAGYTDWYLPARDELEILYRNLKNTTTDNSPGTYDGKEYGTNTNSIPVGTAYTSSDPSQTQIELFKHPTGSEAFAVGFYWSSSRALTQPAYIWYQAFNLGIQGWGSYPTESFNVRPVRRELG